MKAEELITLYINSDAHPMSESSLDEASKIKLIWDKLPSRIKGKVTIKQLSDFLEYLDDIEEVDLAAKHAKISKVLAADVLAAVDNLGLL